MKLRHINGNFFRSPQMKAVLRGTEIGVFSAALTTSALYLAVEAQPLDDAIDHKIVEQVTPVEQHTLDSVEPYDRAIGNGHYVLHNFIGHNNIKMNNLVPSLNLHLWLGETYLKGHADDFAQSLANRPTAQKYFAPLLQKIQTNDNFRLDPANPGDTRIDMATNTITSGTQPVMLDIMMNMDNQDQQYAFYCLYRIIANEARKEGLGNYHNRYAKSYQDEQSFDALLASTIDLLCGLNIKKTYENQDFTIVTNMLDMLLDTAAGNLSQRNNAQILPADLRRVVNLSLATESLTAVHNFTRNNLQHHNCAMGAGVINAMHQRLDQIHVAEQEARQR